MKYLVAMVLVVAACGGDDPVEFEPIVSSTLVGRQRGDAMTFDAGIAFSAQGGVQALVMGTGNITCEAFAGTMRPQAFFAYVVPMIGGTTLAVQTYTDASVGLEEYASRRVDVVGSDMGLVTITTLSETTVAGSVDWTYTQASDGAELGYLAGTFEVTRCP